MHHRAEEFVVLRSPCFAALIILASIAALPVRADHPTAGLGHGIGGPIVTIDPHTLPQGSWAVGARLEYVRFDPFSDQDLEAAALAGEDLHSTAQLLSPSLSVAFGMTGQLTLGLRLPYVLRSEIREAHLEAGVPEVHRHGDSDGIGDLTVLGQYRLIDVHGGFAAALLGGVKLPTGESDARTEAGDPFEVEHQPGSGSTDPMVGVALAAPWGKGWSWGSSVLATIATKGTAETNLGSLVNANLALVVRPGYTHDHGAGHDDHGMAFDLILEANGEWRDRMDIAGAKDDNSGGTLIYLAPGMRIGSPGRWSLDGAVGIPLFQDLNGSQHDTRLRVLVGLGHAF